MVVNTTVTGIVDNNETLSLGLASNQNVDSSLIGKIAYTNGSSAGQVSTHWELTGVALAAGASVTYTLSALTDSLGRAIAFTKVRALGINVRTGNRTAGD